MDEEKLLAAGYKLYRGGAAQLKHADRYYAKMLTDEIGKRFQMVVYVYEYPQKFPETSFMPEVQFHNREDDLCVDITLHNRPEFDISFIESYYTDLWVFHGRPYYEKWGE